ncbi:MAG: hypothetical protein NTX43_10610 [Bacteroidetes bacterium]|nr:hypothetical protein [Bacteroidota bacterium]
MSVIHRFLLITTIIWAPVILYAQQKSPPVDIGKESMYFPHHFQKYHLQTGLGFDFIKLPFDWVENALEAPLLDLHLTFGLPAGFSLEGNLNTILVSNQVSLGARWNYIHRNFSFNLGYDLGYSLGIMNFAGFKNTGMTLIHYPNASIGFKTKTLAFTFKGEAVIIAWGQMKTGEDLMSRSINFFDGMTGAIYLEQRIFRKKILIIGFKDNYVKYYWPAWMVFSTFDRYYHIPELHLLWVL